MTVQAAAEKVRRLVRLAGSANEHEAAAAAALACRLIRKFDLHVSARRPVCWSRWYGPQSERDSR